MRGGRGVRPTPIGSLVGLHLGQLAGPAFGTRVAHVVVAPSPGSSAGSVLVAPLVHHGGEALLIHVHVGDGVQQAVDAVWEVVHAGVAATFGVPGDTLSTGGGVRSK